jgi:hypothetical protein
MSPAAAQHQATAGEQVSIGTTQPVSWAFTWGGGPASDMSLARRGSLSGDGRYVTFYSLADNLAVDDYNEDWDVFVRDMRRGEGELAVWRVSVDSEGYEVEGDSCCSVISADGRTIAFQSEAYWLVDNDDNNCTDVFVHALASGETLQEDRCRLKGQGARAMAVINNLVLGLLRNRSTEYIPDARRYYAANLDEAIALVLRSPAPG